MPWIFSKALRLQREKAWRTFERQSHIHRGFKPKRAS
jgi:hypothetical protein